MMGRFVTSTNVMLKKCAGLVGTKDVTEWESDFLASILDRSQDGDRPDLLTEKQVDVLERIHSKHFAG
jgi:hypothetical protein